MNNNYYRQEKYDPNFIPTYNGMTAVGNNNSNFNNMNTAIAKFSYTDSIIQANIGKNAKVYMSFPDSIEWRDRIFEGTIIAAGKDYLLMRDNNKQNLLWNIYINFIEFQDQIIY